MQALNEFMNQQAAAGVELSPGVVQQQLEGLIGNEWYLRGSFPAGELMDTLLKKQNQAALDAQAQQQIKRLQGAADAQNLIARTLASEAVDASDPGKVVDAAKKMLGQSYDSYFDKGIINPGRLAVAIQGERDNIARTVMASDQYVTSQINPDDWGANGVARSNTIARYGDAIGKIVADRRLADLNNVYTKASGEIVGVLGKDDLLLRGYHSAAVDEDTKRATLRQRAATEYARLGIKPTDAMLDSAVSGLAEYFKASKKASDASVDIGFIDAATKDPEVNKAITLGRFELVRDRLAALAAPFGLTEQDAISRLEKHRELTLAANHYGGYQDMQKRLTSIAPADLLKMQEDQTRRQESELVVEANALKMGKDDVTRYSSVMKQLAGRYALTGRTSEIILELSSGKYKTAAGADSTRTADQIAAALGLRPMDPSAAAAAQLRAAYPLKPGTPFDDHVRDFVRDRRSVIERLERQVAVLDPNNTNETLWRDYAPTLRQHLARVIQDVEDTRKELLSDLYSADKRALYGGGVSDPQRRAEYAEVLEKEVAQLRARLNAIKIPSGPVQRPAPAAPQSSRSGNPFDPGLDTGQLYVAP